ncbi:MULTISPECIES: hypothetical protein [Bradyrhizobium]|uniref:hypothetical protein n=1 Tax=Bradyrhizobium TaxID=374 RepID=UPI001B8A605B|nr:MULTISPECIES: hypothetical protein [Bradyrhizobium]MBR0969876.1 hypothetical protein [Bradyrhizobium japonicum]
MLLPLVALSEDDGSMKPVGSHTGMRRDAGEDHGEAVTAFKTRGEGVGVEACMQTIDAG